MRKAIVEQWYLQGCNRCYKAAYTHTIYSAQYHDVVYNYHKYNRKYGARKAKWFIKGVVEQHDNFLEMERDYYGR